MIPSRLTTEEWAPTDQLDAWQQWFSPTFEVTPGQRNSQGFIAENSVWKAGDLVISRTSAPPVLSIRAKRNIARNPVDHWVLTLCRQGSSKFQTPRTTLEVPPGAVFLWSLGEHSECERQFVDRFQIFIPRDSAQRIGSVLDAARGSVLKSPLAALFADYMVALERWLPLVDAKEIPRLNAAIHSMIVACFAPSAENVALARPEIMRGQMERVRQAVQRHLCSPALGPAMLCQIAGISRSQLYRLFEHVGGVARYIRRRRLLCAHATLSAPENRRTIAEVANDLCFADASAFSRAFRSEFGYRPSDLRSGRDPLTLVPASHPGHQPERQRFGHLLWEAFK